MSHEMYARAFREARSNPAHIAESLALDVVTSVWEIMQERGMTQKDLANAVGKNPVYINRVLNGSHNLTLRTIAELVAALGQQARIEIAPSFAQDLGEVFEGGFGSGGLSGVIPQRKGIAGEFEEITNYDQPANSERYTLAA